MIRNKFKELEDELDDGLELLTNEFLNQGFGHEYVL